MPAQGGEASYRVARNTRPREYEVKWKNESSAARPKKKNQTVADPERSAAELRETVYGKVKRVTRTGGSLKDELEFTYGPTGQRLTKKVTKSTGDVITSFYFYDASGNMMSIYEHKSTDSSHLYIEEQMMYGSSRLGSVQLHEELLSSPPSPVIYTQQRGQKRYELTNHLGNVLTVISDRRKVNCIADDYDADIINTWDYSPFGAILPGRHVGKKKTVSYLINSTIYGVNDNFTGTSASLTGSPSGGTLNWYELNASTTGVIGSGELNVQGVSGSTLSVAKTFSVVSGKVYKVSFRHILRNGTGTSWTWRIVNHSTGVQVGSTHSFSPTGSWATLTLSSAFTAATTGTYRIEIIKGGSGSTLAPCEYAIDDVQISYEDQVSSTLDIVQGEYRFGFNGQLKDDEIYGEGNSYTAEFWQYDPRIGRRWNIDPVTKAESSNYAAFSNNPIVFIDPKGNTDFYNTSGEKIGTDGVDNKQVLIVLSLETELSISTQMTEKGVAVLLPEQINTTFPLPNKEFMDNVNFIFREAATQTSPFEFGFVVGETASGEMVVSSVTKGKDGSDGKVPSYDHDAGRKEILTKFKARPRIIVHLHPNAIKANGDGTFSVGSTVGSGPDMGGAPDGEYAQMVLGLSSRFPELPSLIDQTTAKSNMGVWVNRTDTSQEVINFFNGKTNKVIDMSYSDFKDLVNTIKEKVSSESDSEKK